MLRVIKTFTAFDTGNDPYSEHDFGAVEGAGDRYFFKLDYYAKDAPNMGSPNPADATLTRRVLTVMLASEY